MSKTLDTEYLATIEEIARIGLELDFYAIGHELSLSDQDLGKIQEHLEAKVQEGEA